MPRVRAIPPWLLQMWSNLDEQPYEPYRTTPSEAKELAGAFAGLPAR